jgi:hypothetical protein
MGIKDIFNELKNIQNDLFGELFFIPETDTIQWFYDGLVNPNIYNDEQLIEIYDIDYDLIKSYTDDNDFGVGFSSLEFNNNSVCFEIGFEY